MHDDAEEEEVDYNRMLEGWMMQSILTTVLGVQTDLTVGDDIMMIADVGNRFFSTPSRK